MNKQKGLATIVIVLLIAAAIGGYLVYSGKVNLNQTTTQVSQPSPTPDASPALIDAGETANWKTYTNEKYGLSFKYPKNYVLKDSGVGTPLIASSEDKLTPLSQYLTVDANLAAIRADYDQAVSVLFEQFKEEKYLKIKNSDNASVTIGPYSLPESNLQNVYGKHMYWKYKNGAVTASYQNVSEEEAKAFDKILSTFKFTD